MLSKVLSIGILVVTITFTGIASMTDTKTSKTLEPETALPKKMVVTVPVADLRSKPESVDPSVKLPTQSTTNPGQESQLLFGEHVLVIQESDDTQWYQVQALEQLKYKDEKWHGYPGWIKKAQLIHIKEFPKNNLVVTNKWAPLRDIHRQEIMLSMGTKLAGSRVLGDRWDVNLVDGTTAHIAASDVYFINPIVTEDEVTSARRRLVHNVLQLKDSPYSWGGRSAPDTKFHTISSVDCSGLTNLAYRTIGLQIPRDAHEQYLMSEKISSGEHIQPGDLVFLAPVTRHDRMNHVMLYLGNNNLIEATHDNTCDHTRIITVKEKLGAALENLTNGQKYNSGLKENYVYFGSYLNSGVKIQQLRDAELR